MSWKYQTFDFQNTHKNEKSSYKLGENICKTCTLLGTVPRIYKELSNSIRKQPNFLNGQNMWSIPSPEKVCWWQIRTQKDGLVRKEESTPARPARTQHRSGACVQVTWRQLFQILNAKVKEVETDKPPRGRQCTRDRQPTLDQELPAACETQDGEARGPGEVSRVGTQQGPGARALHSGSSGHSCPPPLQEDYTAPSEPTSL